MIVAPSLLGVWERSGGDVAEVCRVGRELEAAGADWLHVDVMDGRFVEAKAFNVEVVAALRESVKLPLDVHLMVVKPEGWIGPILAAGGARVVFHPAATERVGECLEQIAVAGAVGGLALDVNEPVELMKHWAEYIQQVVIMTVKAGAGGQAFMPEILGKVAEVRGMVGQGVPVVLDGGIGGGNVAAWRASGVDGVVSGSFVLGGDYAERMAALRA